MSNNRKAGPITLAVGLIMFGAILLTGNISGNGIALTTLKYWPVLLIGLGAEYFIRSYIDKKKYGSGEAQTKFSLATVVVILVVAVLGYGGQKAAEMLKNQDINAIITEVMVGSKYSFKSEFKSKAIDVRPGITLVNMEGLRGRLDLVPSADGKFHVETDITGWGPSLSEARLRTEMVKIGIKEGPVINVYSGQSQVSNSRYPVQVVYRFMIPKGINVVVENEGIIRADNIEANLKIRTSDGDVVLRNIKGDVALEGSSAQVTLDVIDGSVESKLSSGKILIKNVSKNIHADNDDSNIEIISSKPINSNYAISNMNGFIVLKVPEISDATVKAETATGKIRGSLNLKFETDRINQSSQAGPPDQPIHPGEPGYGGKATAVLGSGKGLINLRTETGNIVIDKY